MCIRDRDKLYQAAVFFHLMAQAFGIVAVDLDIAVKGFHPGGTVKGVVAVPGLIVCQQVACMVITEESLSLIHIYRAQLYTVPVQLRSCRRLDETGLAFRSLSRFHPKENCIFLALLRSYPFAALAQGRSAPRCIPGQRAQPNTIPDRSSGAILTGGLFV